MAEAIARRAESPRPGRALRVYQIIALLFLGWLVGRLPGLVSEARLEQASLAESLGLVAAAPAAATTGAIRIADSPADHLAHADLAARVAAQVAADVADATIARLLAAGWGPPGYRAPPLPPPGWQAVPPARMSAPQESVVRIITEARPPDAETIAALGYQLPPQRPVPAGTEGRPASPAPAQSTTRTPASRTEAHALATRGYAQLKAGDRRAAAQSFSRALALDPEAEQATAWAAEVRRLTRRWAISAYSLSREGTSDPLAAAPVLGGGQAGVAVAYTFDPLARRPVSAFARMVSAAAPDGTLDPDTAEAAIGLRWRPFPKAPLALDAERRFAIGIFARDAWAARVSGGGGGRTQLGPVPLLWDAYGEAGVVGEKRADFYAGGQARGGVPLLALGNLSLDAGAGLWAAGQRSGDVSTGRLDLGPSIRMGMSPSPFSAQLDYRVKAAGDAEPGTGLALTVSGNF
jgi:hypothetical protein